MSSRSPGRAAWPVRIARWASAVAIAGLMAPGAAQAEDGPRLRATSETLSFGTVVVGHQAEAALSLTNTGDAPGRITSTTVTGPGFAAVEDAATGTTLAPGEQTTIRVLFAPSAAGPATGSLAFDADDGLGRRETALVGEGAEATRLLRAPGRVAFGSVAPGSRAVRTARLVNEGNSFLTVSRLAPPAAASGFSLVAPPATPFGLAPGGSLDLTVAFEPRTAGAFAGAVGADSDGGSVSVALGGDAPRPREDDGAAGDGLDLPGRPFGGDLGGASLVPVVDVDAPAIGRPRVRGRKLGVALSEAGTLTVVVARLTAGRRSGRKCVAPSRAKKGAPACTRTQTVRTLSRALAAGAGSVTLPALSPGLYRLTLTAHDAAGNTSLPRKLSLTVAAPKKKSAKRSR